ncbi:hypothetical protein E9531_15580 [Lampropedia puyangensis]|uniref:Uncharacterized protein n=1 Tax=Lampropedia puyangensis TaxID=1330072 RepID=A0A4S8ETB9_9BURK|nr:hypothetical protein [Lampropedia puyangensis]THT97716.1 hypothetical protein E9531_15580 [Lampropedia puyangensis]
MAFEKVSEDSHYVTQPMRMATVQALPALGFVSPQGQRFNDFEPTDEACEFISASCSALRPKNKEVTLHLAEWVCGGVDISENTLRNAISPCLPLPEKARRNLRNHLAGPNGTQEDVKRRQNLLAWMDALRANPSAAKLKPAVLDETHWHDIQAGSLFFKAQTLALEALDAVELGMGPKCSYVDATQKAQKQLQKLQQAAQAFLASGNQHSDAKRFCEECTNPNPTAVLKALVQRDGTGLREREDDIIRGPAFSGKLPPPPTDEDAPPSESNATDIPIPEGVSFRLRNFYLLNLDLHGELDAWLQRHKELENAA